MNFREALKSARDRVLRPPIAEEAGRVTSVVLDQVADLKRILTDYGDATGDVAETLGRVLARLSAQVDALVEEVTRLRQVVERSETPTEGP
jgi:hypothetical protein